MKIGVIADDLTGANATGVRLAKQGFTASTSVYSPSLEKTGSFDALCIDTDSRYASPDVKIHRVNAAVKFLQAHQTEVICKRIDSTVRGNIGVELETLLARMGENTVAVVVPSFPDSGRVTSGGYLLVDGVPLQQTDAAKDPQMPITQSHVPSLLQEQTNLPVAHLGLDIVLSGTEAISCQLQKRAEQGYRLIVADAVTDEEIEQIAEAMTRVEGFKLIPVDPGPLTSFYAKAYFKQYVESGKIIATVGSVTAVTERQLHYLMDKTGVSPVYVSAKKLASYSETWEEEVQRAAEQALQAIHKQELLLITTHAPSSELLNLAQIAAEEQVHPEALAKRITDGLAKITRLVIEQTEHRVLGCYLSGGDVTASLCAVGSAAGIMLEDEVLPLAAYGRFNGGSFDGLPLVTKGGMIGDKRAIYTSIQYLKAKSTRRSAESI